MRLVPHEHAWHAVMHLDGCHWYQNSYACDCGAQRVISGERQFFDRGRMTASSMQADLDDCERCRELMSGKRRRPYRDRIHNP